MSNVNEILLCWIPSLTEISGNEQVDIVTRSAFSMVPEKTFKIPYTDLKIKINKYILQQRQHHWSSNNYNKLLEIRKNGSKASEKAEKKKSYYPDCT